MSEGCLASRLLDCSLGAVAASCKGNSIQLIFPVKIQKGFVEKVADATEDARKNECDP